MDYKNLFALLGVFTLVACGGGGGGSSSSPGSSSTVSSGQFKDTNTSGLTYVSGDVTGITDSAGGFSYETGRPVTFSVGGVELGTTTGRSIVTPVDLLVGGDSTDTEVLNIVRFLLMLDLDGDPTNGITISNAVQLAAENWSQVNFGTSNLGAELASIISDANVADGVTHVLPDSTTAQNHLEATLRCSYAGAYRGTFTGTDAGNFGFLVDAINGNVLGIAYSTVFDTFYGVSAVTPISYEQEPVFVSGNTTAGGTFTGQFTSYNDVTGTWLNSPDNGSFSGSRIGGAQDAVFRFTGNFIGDSFGLFSFDINSSNAITGIAYSLTFDELVTLSGTLSGTTLTGTASDGTTISGTLNTSTGALSGSWNFAPLGNSGTFSGSGCKLN